MNCPQCGYREPLCWHYPIFHGKEMPYARIEELRKEEPELAEKVENGTPIRPKVLEYVDSCYAYKYNLKSGFVRKRVIELWKAFKWGSVPMEKRKPFVPGKQIKLTVVQKHGEKNE